MKHLLPLAFLISACAAPPTLYGQGVPVAPRAPAFNSVTDAPITIGQPGHIAQPKIYPRGTDRRVLPPTKEPTIFASDRPMASSASDDSFLLPYMVGVDRASPPELMGEHNAISPTRWCHTLAKIALRESVAQLRPIPLSAETDHVCLASLYIETCVREIKDKNRYKHPSWQNHVPIAIARMKKERARWCNSTPGKGAVDDVFSRVFAGKDLLPLESP